MDPVIVTILVKVLTPPVQRLTGDAYGALKDLLIHRYGRSVATSLQRLENNPASRERQKDLAQALHAAGADVDGEVLLLAEALEYLIENPEALNGNLDVLEAVQRRVGLSAIVHVMEDHVKKVLTVRAKYSVEDSELLTSNVIHSRNVPRRMRSDLAELHSKIRDIIQQISEKIENGKYREAEEAVQGFSFSLIEREQATKLIGADKQLHVSYQTLRTTVEFFSQLNQRILSRIEHADSPSSQSSMMLGNATMIYELADFVISYIESFTMHGVNEIDSLYAEIRKKFAEIQKEASALETLANRPNVPSEVRDQTFLDMQNRQGAVEVAEHEWSNYVGEVKRANGILGEVRAKIPALEVIRANAKAQISVIRLVDLLRILKQNTEAVTGTIDALQGFRLAPLTSNRVRRLLSVSPVH